MFKHQQLNMRYSRDISRMDRLRKAVSSLSFWKKRRMKAILSMTLAVLLMYCLTRSVRSGSEGTEAEIGKQQMIDSQKALPLVRASHSPRQKNTLHPNRRSSHKFLIQTFTFLLNEPYFCLENNFLVVIFVCSAPLNVDRRSAIRKTWGNLEFLQRSQVAVLFVLGRTNSHRQQLAIKEESMRYRDVIQADFEDSYKNLTLKTLTALKWFSSYCSSSRFLMKTDDDIYINVPLLAKFLEARRGETKFLGGCVKKHVGVPLKVIHGHRVPSIPNTTYSHPPFLAGAGYVISGDITHSLFEIATKKRVIPVEDAFITGHCARELNFKVQHFNGFSCGEKINNYCQINSTMYTVHHVNPRIQIDTWKILYKNRTFNC